MEVGRGGKSFGGNSESIDLGQWGFSLLCTGHCSKMAAQCVKGLLPRKSNQEVVGSSPGCDPCSIRK